MTTLETLASLCLVGPLLAQPPLPARDVFAGTFATLDTAGASPRRPAQIAVYAWDGDWFTGARYVVDSTGAKRVQFSYRAKFDGHEYAFISHPTNTLVLRRLSPRAWTQTERKNGKLIATYTHVYSEDGDTLTNVITLIADDGSASSQVSVSRRQVGPIQATQPDALRANADTTSERELRAILAELSGAVLRHEPEVVRKYYSPDYVMTFADGRRGDFENSLHVLTDTTRNEWHTHDISNERFVFYGSTAVVTFTVHSQWVSRASQKAFDVHEQATQTWIRRNGRWTLVATHVTRGT